MKEHKNTTQFDNSIEIRRRDFCAFLVASNPTLRTVLSAQLCHEGLNILPFSSLDDIVLSEETPEGCPHNVDLLLLQQPSNGQHVEALVSRVRNLDIFANVPIVMISEDRHYSILMSSIAFGATDYILIPATRRELVRHISRVLGVRKIVANSTEAAFIDDIHPALEREIKRTSRSKAPFSVIVGHLQFGDQISLSVAEEDSPEIEEVELKLEKVYDVYMDKISSVLRQTDMIAAFGLREFVLILPFTTREGVEMVVEKLEGVFVKVVNAVNSHLNVALKLGSATCPDDAEEKTKLINLAHRMAEI